MRVLHIQLEGFSAAYPYPFLRSGTQLTLPAPPFSTVLGNLSACAGRVVRPEESMIAFEFRSEGTAMDLERTRRLRMDNKTGKLRENPEQGLASREFHVRPRLDLYLTELGFRKYFESPAATPCLGRSQDIAWIRTLEEIELETVESGRLGPTLIPFPNFQVGGQVLPPLADYFINDQSGHLRRIGKLSRYQFVPEGAAVSQAEAFELYHPSDSRTADHVVYLHSLTA